jgi:hypothetical protein
MFNLDLFWTARWDELYLFLLQGNPPLYVLLLGVNTLFLIFYMVRRARKPTKLRPSTVYFVQGAVILTNALILFNDEAMRYAMRLKGIL